MRGVTGGGADGALPNVIVIGAGRCGTTSLHHYLDAHPEVGMSRPKELRFFADQPDADASPTLRDPVDRRLARRRLGQWRLGIPWYRSHFDPSAPIRGESSPVYTSPWFPGTAERMARVVPGAKLIFCVRDPVERAVSHYRLVNALGHEPRPIDTALASGDGFYAVRSRFAAALRRYRALFGADGILVLDAAELLHDTRSVLQRVFSFLEVDDGFWSPTLERRWNSTGWGPPWRSFVSARRSARWARFGALLPRRSLWWLERLSTAGGAKAPLERPAPETVERLARSLVDDAARLRSLTGLRFPTWSV